MQNGDCNCGSRFPYKVYNVTFKQVARCAHLGFFAESDVSYQKLLSCACLKGSVIGASKDTLEEDYNWCKIGRVFFDA